VTPYAWLFRAYHCHGHALRLTYRRTLAQICGAIILIAIVAPYFLVAMFVIAIMYAHAANFYRASAREFKVRQTT
jgi:hypothetical protein